MIVDEVIDEVPAHEEAQFESLWYFSLHIEPDQGGFGESGLGEVHQESGGRGSASRRIQGRKSRKDDTEMSMADLGNVAENSKVCLVSGSLARISLSCSPRPISNSLW